MDTDNSRMLMKSSIWVTHEREGDPATRDRHHLIVECSSECLCMAVHFEPSTY